MLTYYVSLTPDDDTLLVECPDLPEVITFGEDKEDALGYAVGAIEEALACRMNYREDIPAPRRKNPGGLHPVRLPSLTMLKVELYREMRRQSVSKAELARRMGIARQSVDRLLALNHASRLDAMDCAFAALKQTLTIGMEQVA